MEHGPLTMGVSVRESDLKKFGNQEIIGQANLDIQGWKFDIRMNILFEGQIFEFCTVSLYGRVSDS